MSNHTLYIQNENDDKFSKEPRGEKGPLVNALLAGYYAGDIQLTGSTATGTMVSASSTNNAAMFASQSTSEPTCPNGHLLAADHKCLTKGCKYSR